MSKQDLAFNQVSPRRAVALRLSDTLLCLGHQVERKSDPRGHLVCGQGVEVLVVSDRAMSVFGLGQRRSFRWLKDCQLFLIENCEVRHTA